MTGVTGATASTAATTASTSALSSSDSLTSGYTSGLFLKLLVTQLQNQDPSSPMDSTQMISQTSQLASMQQLTALNESTVNSYDLQMRSAAANVLGKTVTWDDPTSGDAMSGTVSAVSFSGSTPTVTVGSSTVSLTDLTGIGEPASTTTTTSTTAGSTS